MLDETASRRSGCLLRCTPIWCRGGDGPPPSLTAHTARGQLVLVASGRPLNTALRWTRPIGLAPPHHSVPRCTCRLDATCADGIFDFPTAPEAANGAHSNDGADGVDDLAAALDSLSLTPPPSREHLVLSTLGLLFQELQGEVWPALQPCGSRPPYAQCIHKPAFWVLRCQ